MVYGIRWYLLILVDPYARRSFFLLLPCHCDWWFALICLMLPLSLKWGNANCLITSSQACVYQACRLLVEYDASGFHYLSLYGKILEATNLPVTAKKTFWSLGLNVTQLHWLITDFSPSFNIQDFLILTEVLYIEAWGKIGDNLMQLCHGFRGV